MQKIEKIKIMGLVIFSFFILFFYSVSFSINAKSIPVNSIQNMKLIPSGELTGIKLKTKGTMFMGLSDVIGIDNKIYVPCKELEIETGDIITKVGDVTISNSDKLLEQVQLSKGNRISITYINSNNEVSVESVTPIFCKEDGKYHIGMWVKDGIIGIGTISFYNPITETFFALGHGVSDPETNEIIDIETGKLVNAKIIKIKKGSRLMPGEIQGIFNNESISGEILKNTKKGIMGTYTKTNVIEKYKNGIEVSKHSEIKKDNATILCNIDGQIKEYTAKINKICSKDNKENKNIVIEITDEELIEKTGGIVQGMSGSPIIQNNKIIGTVTHVFLNNPKCGYGVSIENILESM